MSVLEHIPVLGHMPVSEHMLVLEQKNNITVLEMSMVHRFFLLTAKESPSQI